MKNQKIFSRLGLVLLFCIEISKNLSASLMIRQEFGQDDVAWFSRDADQVRKILSIMEVVTIRSSSLAVDPVQVQKIIDIVKVVEQPVVQRVQVQTFLIDAINSRETPAVVAQSFSDVFPEYALDLYQNVYLMYGTLSDLARGFNSQWDFDVCLTLSGQSSPVIPVTPKNKQRVKAIVIELYKKWQLFFNQKNSKKI